MVGKSETDTVRELRAALKRAKATIAKRDAEIRSLRAGLASIRAKIVMAVDLLDGAPKARD